MRTDRGSGGRSAFFGLALMILGGLLFAAGVMVGRQMTQDETTKSKHPLMKIDQRDQEPKKSVDGGELVFHEALDTEKPAPATAPQAVPKTEPEPVPKPAPVPVPEIETAPSPKFSLQVAAYRERSQAEGLVKKLSEKGYGQARIVTGEVAGKGVYYRVRLGPLSKSDAEKSKGRLEREERLKVFLLKEQPQP